MLRNIFLALSIAFLANFIESLTDDYYWRDWNSTVPTDAYIAGNNSNNVSIYIVQAYVDNYGLYIGYISDGEVSAKINTGNAQGSPLNTSSVLKVLCVQNVPFQWIQVDTSTIDTILEYNLAVVGGFSSVVGYNKVVYVGRYIGANDTIIGSVHSDYWMYYSNGSSGLDISEYELLVRRM